MLGEPGRPARLLADGRQSDRAALLAAEPGAGDLPVAQPGLVAIDRPAVPTVGTSDLDGKLVSREVAEGRAGVASAICNLRGMPVGRWQQQASARIH